MGSSMIALFSGDKRVKLWSLTLGLADSMEDKDVPFSVFQSNLGQGTRGGLNSSVPLTAKCPEC